MRLGLVSWLGMDSARLGSGKWDSELGIRNSDWEYESKWENGEIGMSSTFDM